MVMAGGWFSFVLPSIWGTWYVVNELKNGPTWEGGLPMGLLADDSNLHQGRTLTCSGVPSPWHCRCNGCNGASHFLKQMPMQLRKVSRCHPTAPDVHGGAVFQGIIVTAAVPQNWQCRACINLDRVNWKKIMWGKMEALNPWHFRGIFHHRISIFFLWTSS